MISAALVNIELLWVLSSELHANHEQKYLYRCWENYCMLGITHSYLHCTAAVKINISNPWNKLTGQLAATCQGVKEGVGKILQNYHKWAGEAKATFVHTSAHLCTPSHKALPSKSLYGSYSQNWQSLPRIPDTKVDQMEQNWFWYPTYLHCTAAVKMNIGGKPTDHFAAICQEVRQGVGQEIGAILQKQHKLGKCKLALYQYIISLHQVT